MEEKTNAEETTKNLQIVGTVKVSKTQDLIKVADGKWYRLKGKLKRSMRRPPPGHESWVSKKNSRPGHEAPVFRDVTPPPMKQ